jgi:predicted RNA-binding Zn-ribbon protein involved in translation (DUF1610 family)
MSEGPKNRCPQCGSDRIHRSHRRGAIERTLSLLGAEIRRCHPCRGRYAWFGSRAIRLVDPSAGRMRASLALGAGFLVCLVLVWWMILRFTELSG